MTSRTIFDAIVVGGGPAGATAAADLARLGRSVLLLDRQGRIKPCGGAIPPRAIERFAIPPALLVARIDCARIVSPEGRKVDIHIEGGFVGMVDRDVFDEWLRDRAARVGAVRASGTFERFEREPGGLVRVFWRAKGAPASAELESARARFVIGADGANSAVARQAVPGARERRFVFAYHEVCERPPEGLADYAQSRCDVLYDGRLSPDFYSWLFPHGPSFSIGTGSAVKGFALRDSVAAYRRRMGLDGVRTIRREGAPIPLEPLRRWDNGRDVLLAGDAAGVVAPASGEGIFYAMEGGRLAAEAVHEALATGDAKALATARRRFVRAHGAVFWILGVMQRYWYGSDERRERFVAICRDKDVQELTFAAYMNKELVKARPLAHLRIVFKNLAHLAGLIPA
jgi:geranylgeranyl reductase